MKATLPIDLIPIAVRGPGEARCRRYMFDRPYGQDACAPAADVTTPKPGPKPEPKGWDEVMERPQ
jgi:hypothetical protein